jgi:glycosyltransferase involved in cell wall biosynthesis
VCKNRGVVLVILHHHFRPGGVRRVIELATPHIVAAASPRIHSVVLASGEAPDTGWLQSFRRRLGHSEVKALVAPGFRYAAEQERAGQRLTRRVREGLAELFHMTRPDSCLIWAHNLGLGRNLPLARELTAACHGSGTPLIAHHHDWWFENRWHHFAAMRGQGFRSLPSVARAVLAASPHICHAAINQADGKILEQHFPGLAGWLPNPVERGAPPPAKRLQLARSWLAERLGGRAPVWLVPCRLLRRKNLAEALLLARWLRPEAWLVTTGGASSAAEQPYADTLAAAAQKHGWRLRLGVLQGDESLKPTVAELLAASEAVLLTSLQEGFGLPYLEAAAARRPLIARQLPNIAPDLAQFGFKFPQSYSEVLVEPSLFDWAAERERQRRMFAAWKRRMPSAVARRVCPPKLLAAGATPGPMAFSRLTLPAQLEVLAQPLESSWARCVPLNPFLARWRDRAGAGRLAVSAWPRQARSWLDGKNYARRFCQLIPAQQAAPPGRGASATAQAALLRLKLRLENLYPLLWHSQW